MIAMAPSRLSTLRAGAVALAAAFSFGAAHAQPSPAAAPSGKDLLGAPVIARAGGPAYHLWVDDQGWHLRWTAPAVPQSPQKDAPGAEAEKSPQPPVFTGIVRVMAGVRSIQPVMAGGDDSLSRVDQRRAFFKSVISEQPVNGIDTPGVEGMDFKVPKGAEAIELELFIDYAPVTPAQVKLGPLQTQPADVLPSVLIPLKGR